MFDNARLETICDEFLDLLEGNDAHQKNCKKIVKTLNFERFEGICAMWIYTFYKTGNVPDTEEIANFLEAMENVNPGEFE